VYSVKKGMKRTDIHALRAIAVLSVFVYHFFPEIFNSGYLGVDIFFFISGYLILSQIIDNNLNGFNDAFSYLLRRIKRLLPSFISCLLIVTLLSAFILLPSDYVAFQESLFQVLLANANYHFWRDGGYFGLSNELKPLLHFWSLSVEIQFYFLACISVIFVKAVNRSHFIFAFLIILLSISVREYLYFIDGVNPAFFLTPSRLWEFFLGGILFVTRKKFPKLGMNPKWIKLSIFFLIVIFCLFANNISPYHIRNNYIVLLLCLVFIGLPDMRLSVLNNKVIDFFADISYPLYLIHWPIIVLLRYVHIGEVSLPTKLSFMLIVVILSYLIFRFIEKPLLRKKMYMSLIGFIAILPCALILNSSASRFNNDFTHDVFSSAVNSHFRCELKDYFLLGDSRACSVGKDAVLSEGSFVLLGNSHMQMYTPIFAELADAQNVSGVLVPLNSCLPLPNLNRSRECSEKARNNIETLIANFSNTLVFVGMTWHHDRLWSSVESKEISVSPDDYLSELNELRSILSQNNIDVIVIGPLMRPNFSIASTISRGIKFGHFTFDESVALLEAPVDTGEFRHFEQILLSLRASDLKVLFPHYAFCVEAMCSFGDTSGSYFSDSSHLSAYGLSKLIGIREKIESILMVRTSVER
jgi:peptidoglycan/LPS O-acetylase OafA/YrhL